MPLLAGTGTQGTDATGPVVADAGLGLPLATWTAPDGRVWNLTDDPYLPGVITLPGVAGIGAAPRSTVRRSLSTGGAMSRWSHVEERFITWPVLFAADGDPEAFATLSRSFVRAFTSTTPPAGIPSLGTLRVTRANGSWREIKAMYETGLQGLDAEGMGLDKATAVITLVAPDPWWYGPQEIAADFTYTLSRAYVGTTGGASGVDPYQTVSPTNASGASTFTVVGDVDALPVWTLTGPATSITVAVGSASFTYNAVLLESEQVIVDVGAMTVATTSGANMMGNLSWPSSTLFPLPPGPTSVDITINGAAAGASVQLSYRPRYESS